MASKVGRQLSQTECWWLSVGLRLGQQASKSACLVAPPLFRADLGSNLIKQGENVKGRPSGSVRVPVGPRFFPFLLSRALTALKLKCVFE